MNWRALEIKIPQERLRAICLNCTNDPSCCDACGTYSEAVYSIAEELGLIEKRRRKQGRPKSKPDADAGAKAKPKAAPKPKPEPKAKLIQPVPDFEEAELLEVMQEIVRDMSKGRLLPPELIRRYNTLMRVYQVMQEG